MTATYCLKDRSGCSTRESSLLHRLEDPLSPLVLDALIEQRERHQAQRQKAGDRWREQGFVFTSGFGDNWHPDTATKVFAELRELADLPDTIHLHSLRPLFASTMIGKGIHPKLAQQHGHFRSGTMLDKYSHFLPGARSTMPSVMEAYIAPGRGALEKSRKNRGAPTVGPKRVLEMPKKVG
jgi:hypothetical protein